MKQNNLDKPAVVKSSGSGIDQILRNPGLNPVLLFHSTLLQFTQLVEWPETVVDICTSSLCALITAWLDTSQRS